MKYILVILILLGLGIYLIAANRPVTISEEGIQFYEGTLSEALIKSKELNKPVFVEVSTSWCGYCKKLKRNAFSDKEIGSYFNENFINISVDAEKGEGPEVAQKYSVKGYPTMFVVDKSGQVLLYSAGYMESNELLRFGKSALKHFN